MRYLIVSCFQLASQSRSSSNCSVLFNFRSASFYQATLMVIQVVKEDCNFGTKAFLVSCYLGQGHPTTVFCTAISVRRSKNCLEFSLPWRRLRISRWPFHLCIIFEACLINSVRFSEDNFWHFTLHLKLFFAEKGNLKFWDSIMRWKEDSEKFSLILSSLRFSGR